MVQFQNEFVTVELVNNSKVVALTWKGFVPSNTYREILEKALEIAKKYKAKYWISDIKHMKVISVKDQEWAVQNGCQKL